MKTKRNPIALNLPQAVALLIVYGRHVVEMMAKSPALFANLLSLLPGVTKNLDDLETAEVAAKTKAKGTASARDDAKTLVVDDIVQLKGGVQSIVHKNPATALTIILAAGMQAKQFKLRHKPPLEALMGPVPQQVLLRAKAPKGKAAYEWQFSADGGKTWVTIGVTTDANTSVQGLTVGVDYQFRFRTTVKKVTSAWSQIVSLFVH